MKAVLFDTGAEVRLTDLPVPAVGDEDVLVQVGACGICASDLHLAEINAGIADLPYPFVPGHEVAGTVVEAGAAVKNVRQGDRVVVQPVVTCGMCPPCRKGHPNLCQDAQAIGLQLPGGFAEFVTIPAQNAYATGDLPDNVAACTEPLACALHGLARLSPGVADRVLIFGAGAIGLFFLQLVRNRGAGHITAVDIKQHRLDVARQLGADYILLADGARARTMEEIEPQSYDCVVDATGVPSVVAAAFQYVAPAGKLLMLGSCPTDASITLQPRTIQRYDVTVVGAFAFNYEFAAALRLLQEKRIQIDPIVTHSYPLDAAPEAFVHARRGDKGIKIQIVPN